eukprot:scaffold28718_cov21-Tisochrysis_lutea.AAC.1
MEIQRYTRPKVKQELLCLAHTASLPVPDHLEKEAGGGSDTEAPDKQQGPSNAPGAAAPQDLVAASKARDQ